jgi:hypothetical protein
MSEIIQLFEHSFDSLENDSSAARSKTLLASFQDDEKKVAHRKCSEYLSTLKPTLYLGWDGVVYPHYTLVKTTVQ